MSETYRKRGRNVRLERRGESAAIVRTTEHGEASIADGVFRARTLPAAGPEGHDAPSLEAIHQTIAEMIAAPLLLERSTLIEGVVDHWWTDGESEREWRESSARAHLTVCNPRQRVRCVTSLGASSLDRIDLGPLAATIDALGSLSGEPPPRGPLTLGLEPQVSAELWPALLGLIKKQPGAPGSSVGSLQLRQGVHPEISLDGTGAPVRTADLFETNGLVRFPNIFRPSYRIRPVRAPFHLESINIDRSSATPDSAAVAVLDPFSSDEKRLGVALLCRGTEGAGSFVCRISMPLEHWLTGLARSDEETLWFPVSAGSYGRRVVLERVLLRPIRE